MSDWPRVQLHVVTGKGGTGKSTVAASLALALARPGRRVLLCEVEGRQGIARLFGLDPLPYEERRVAAGLPGPQGRAGAVHALHIDPESALREYLAGYHRLGPAGRALDRLGFVDFCTTLAPGMRDVLLTGKVYEAARSGRKPGAARYDAVVLDAPPTGRIAQFLNVSGELAGLARVGTVRGRADRIMALLRSPATAVHLVTVLEEMPVQETRDGVAQLRGDGLPVGGVVVNMMRPDPPGAGALTLAGDGEPSPDTVAGDLARAGMQPANRDAVVAGLLTGGRDHARRRDLEDRQRLRLADLDAPTYELPRLAGGVDAGALLALAQRLRAGGMA